MEIISIGIGPAHASITEAVETSIKDTQTPSVAIVEAAVAVTNTVASECPRLYDRINTDALNKVFANSDGGQITVDYADCQVTVHGDRAVTVTPTDTT